MLTNPQTLEECMDVVANIRQTIARELANVPETQGHQEVHNMLVELDRLSPDVIEKHKLMQDRFQAARANVDQKLNQAKEKLAAGKALLAGEVPQNEIEAMWRERLGEAIVPVPLPDAPSGWRDRLEQELRAQTRPQTSIPLSALESNAWNDWQLDTPHDV